MYRFFYLNSFILMSYENPYKVISSNCDMHVSN